VQFGLSAGFALHSDVSDVALVFSFNPAYKLKDQQRMVQHNL